MPRLDEPEDVVDEQQDIPVFIVPEVLGDGQRGVAHAKAAARRLVHLAEQHHHVRQHARVLHVAVQLLTFATAFANATKNADTFLVTHHVVDEFREQHRLADARAAEQPGLAPTLEREQDIDGLDSSLKHFGLGGTSGQRRGWLMYGTPVHIGESGTAIDGPAEDVEHVREHVVPHGYFQWTARVLDEHAPGEALRGREGDPTHRLCVTLDQHLDDDRRVAISTEYRMDRRQGPVETDVDDTAAHGHDDPAIR